MEDMRQCYTLFLPPNRHHLPDDTGYRMTQVVHLTSTLRAQVNVIDWEGSISYFIGLSLTFKNPKAKAYNIDLSITIKSDNSREENETANFNAGTAPSGAGPHVIWGEEGPPLPENIRFEMTNLFLLLNWFLVDIFVLMAPPLSNWSLARLDFVTNSSQATNLS